MDTVEVHGLRIAYERAGRGPAVVLLHGFVADGIAVWHRQVEALAEAFTVVVWDAPGAGGSSDPPEDFGMVGYADCLAAFVDALGLERPHVAGLSFGGALALALQQRHPGVPSTLTLVSAYAGWEGSLPAEVARTRLSHSLDLSRLAPEEFVDALLPTMFSDGTPEDTVSEMGAAMLASLHPTGFRAMARASAEDLRGALPSIDVPTLLVYGDRDVRAPLSVAEALHEGISGSRLVVLPGAGHLCNVEAPEAFNAAMRTFLDERTT